MPSDANPSAFPGWHATTILMVRKDGQTVIGGDGQVSLGQTIIKGNARKVRRLGKGEVIAGFAGATADAFTLFERLEAKLEQYPGQLTRACVEMAKDWRTDRYLRRLEAMMLVADKQAGLVLTGTATCWSPRAASWASDPAAITRSPPPAPSSTSRWTLRRSCARRWRLPARSASTRTATSWWRGSMPAEPEITFRPVRPDDFAMLTEWLARPHWREWWGDPTVELGYIRDMVEGATRTATPSSSRAQVSHWVISRSGGSDRTRRRNGRATTPG